MIGEADHSPYTGVPGWLTIPEEDLLIKYARNVPNHGIIANIGVEFGRSMAAFSKFAPGVEIIGIEIKPLKAYGMNLTEAGLEVPPLLIGSSNDPINVAKFKDATNDKGIDFLFIDGDHSINGSAKDLELWAPLVKVGGFMALHDTACATNLVAHHTHFDVSRSLALWYRDHGVDWIAADMVDSITSFKRIS